MTLRSTPKLVIQLCSLASYMEYMQNEELSLIKNYESIQHLNYKIFSVVAFCSQKLGIYYFRQFENACHVQENCYETLGTKLVFTITSNTYVEVSVLKISERKTTRMLDYYIPTKKINNNVITKIMSKFVEGKESNYSELKDCLEGYVNE